jgi:ankyrin repeat protein
MTEIVKLLLENKANEHLKDEDGITPLEIAHSPEIQNLFIKD